MGTVTNSLKGAFRIGQTVSVLGRAGVNWVRGDRPPAPRLLRQTFESLGATYIKLGQFIASSPTFFPKEYVEEFQYCLDRTPNLPFGVIKNIIRDELGGRSKRCTRILIRWHWLPRPSLRFMQRSWLPGKMW